MSSFILLVNWRIRRRIDLCPDALIISGVPVCDSLKDDDKLLLARYLSLLSEIQETELFVSEPLTNKLKVLGTILGAAIPIALSIFQLLRLAIFPGGSSLIYLISN
jgi:hypothetical protein